jgi:PTH1 family peptidyl-tRNA hydrolase
MKLEESGTNSHKRCHLVVGLGNPGAQYAGTRHNIGFMVVDRLASEFDLSLGHIKFDARFGRGEIAGEAVILAKPLAYMNRSGQPVKLLADYFRIPAGDVFIIHDDIDLAFGRLKIKEKGGHGGHNGIRSLIAAFGGGGFKRLRVGIGRSAGGASVTGHVLGRFDDRESKQLDEIICRARDAVTMVLREGTQTGMNYFNSRTFYSV